MLALIISDDEWTALRIRQGLSQHGYECPPSQTVASDLAGSFLSHSKAELIVVVLSPDVERLVSLVSEARSRSRAPILAVGPVGDVRLVLRTMRGGANEYLDQDDLDAELEAAVRRSRQGEGGRRTGQMIVVYGPCGGTGSSSVTVNLGIALAKLAGRSLLIDLKVSNGDLAPMLNLKPPFTLADLCEHVGQLDRTLYQRSLAVHPTGVHLLAPPPPGQAYLPTLTPNAIQQTLGLGRALFPHVLIDLDRSFRQAVEPAVLAADRILLVLRLDFTSLRNARRALEEFANLGVGPDRVRVLVNRRGQPREIDVEKAEEALGMKIYHSIPDDPKVMNQANNYGEPALVSASTTRIGRSLMELGRLLHAEPAN